MKKILFIAATSGELKILKQEIRKLNFQNMKIIFLLSGVGNYKTILSLQESITKQKYDFIVNIGVCGYTFTNTLTSPHSVSPNGREVASFIQISRIKNLANSKELIIPVFLKFGELQSIASSEKVVYSSEDMNGENFVEMESYGVELVCTKFQIPRIILKVPIDKVGEETKNFDFNKAKKLLAENIDYEKLVDNIGDYLDSSNTIGNADQIVTEYQEYYRMTFAEKLIFEKLYNKYVVLVEEDGGEKFEAFFEKNKKLKKKDFFVKLKEIE